MRNYGSNETSERLGTRKRWKRTGGAEHHSN